MSKRSKRAGSGRILPVNWPKVSANLKFVTHSPTETRHLGEKLAKDLPCPCVVLLEGELGSGKTTLIKGIVQGLGVAKEEDVTSPSFALVHEYGSEGRVYHVDLYRVESSQELSTLGLDDVFAARSIVLVEWGEKLGKRFANQALRIRMEHAGDDRRKITVTHSAS